MHRQRSALASQTKTSYLTPPRLPPPKTQNPKQDLAAIRAGEYALPWDMTTLSHRQYNPLYILRKCVRPAGPPPLCMAASPQLLRR